MLYRLIIVIYLYVSTWAHIPPTANEVVLQVHVDKGHRIRHVKRSTHSNLRIYLHYDSSLNDLNDANHQFVQQKLLPNAIKFWETSLLVQRSTSPLIRLDRKCESSKYVYVYDRPIKRHCLDGCQENSKCGEVVIPEEHLHRCHTCNLSGECETLGESDGTGVAGYDFLLYVSSVNTLRCADPGTLAYSAHCQQEDELDRPIAGHVNICPSSIKTGERDQELLLSTIRHEILHSLGFSTSLFAFFRYDSGEPRTPRDKDTDLPPLNSESGYYQWGDQTITRIKRSKWLTRSGFKEHSVDVVVTDRVVKFVQHHFNCSELEGAELENQGPLGTKLTHWEKRLFENEAMTGTHTQNPIFSALTFALMEDTGWYKANYSMAKSLHWGRNLGCDFAMASCGEWIENARKNERSARPFCSTPKAITSTGDGDSTHTVCNDARDALAVCNLVSYPAPIPEIYQYFKEIDYLPSSVMPLYGGSVELADYCPYNQEFSWPTEQRYFPDLNDTLDHKRDSRCEFEANAPDVDRNNALELYGSSSRCFDLYPVWQLYRCNWVKTFYHHGAGCYNYICADGRVFMDLYNASASYPCYFAGQSIVIRRIHRGWLHTGRAICPACAELCGSQNCRPDLSPHEQVEFRKKNGKFIGDPPQDVPCAAPSSPNIVIVLLIIAVCHTLFKVCNVYNYICKH